MNLVQAVPASDVLFGFLTVAAPATINASSDSTVTIKALAAVRKEVNTMSIFTRTAAAALILFGLTSVVGPAAVNASVGDHAVSVEAGRNRP